MLGPRGLSIRPSRPDDVACHEGMDIFKPKSWLRYALYVKDFHLYKDWCVAHDGATSQNLPSILLQGLQNPGEPGVSILHGQSYSQTKRTIYLSPSIEYAAFPVYAQLFSLAEASNWGQLVLQCRVRPDSFIERPGSLGNKYWPQHVRFDPNFDSLQGLNGFGRRFRKIWLQNFGLVWFGLECFSQWRPLCYWI